MKLKAIYLLIFCSSGNITVDMQRNKIIQNKKIISLAFYVVLCRSLSFLTTFGYDVGIFKLSLETYVCSVSLEFRYVQLDLEI
jgi:hypothetical protein